MLDRLLEDVAGVGSLLRERVLRRAGGVPFLLVSCARGLRTSALDGGAADTVSWDLMQTIRQRVAALSEPARQELDAAAVVGRQVYLSVLSAVLAQPEEAVLATLEVACRARLLEEQGKVLSSWG